MPKFRKKPVDVDAIEFDGTPLGAIVVFEEFDIPGAKFVPDYDLRVGTLLIPTPEGDHTASRGDWIIKGIEGEFYPCKPSIFKRTYDPVVGAIKQLAPGTSVRMTKESGNASDHVYTVASQEILQGLLFYRLKEVAGGLFLATSVEAV